MAMDVPELEQRPTHQGTHTTGEGTHPGGPPGEGGASLVGARGFARPARYFVQGAHTPEVRCLQRPPPTEVPTKLPRMCAYSECTLWWATPRSVLHSYVLRLPVAALPAQAAALRCTGREACSTLQRCIH